MTLTLFLLRHAAHVGGADVLAGTASGFGLGEGGREQARRLARRFPPGSLDALYTSPMERCRQTAEMVGAECGLVPDVAEAASEIDFGTWSGKSFAALETDPLWQAWNSKRDAGQAPGGESMREVAGRVAALRRDLGRRHATGRIGLVSHAEIIRTAVLQLLGLPLQAYARLEIAVASITVLSLGVHGDRLLGLNDVAHLAALGSGP